MGKAKHFYITLLANKKSVYDTRLIQQHLLKVEIEGSHRDIIYDESLYADTTGMVRYDVTGGGLVFEASETVDRLVYVLKKEF